MCARKALRVTFNWPRRFSPMSKPPEGPRRALGKGLTALLPTRPPAAALSTAVQAEPAPKTPDRIPIEEIDPNPVQPRRVFETERLEELAASIRANGIIQPLVVRPAGARYQLVAGERRWRAAKIAGLEAV